MDEYLFILLAKLKADRLKLEREQRLAGGPEDTTEPPRAAADRRTSKARWFPAPSSDWPART